MVKMQDILDAERDLGNAEEEMRDFRTAQDRYGAYESLTRDGRKELNFTRNHFDRAEILQRKIETAYSNLNALKGAWLKGE